MTLNPITMADEWIKQAFEKARKEANRANPIAVRVRKGLDEHTEEILDKWANVVGRDKSMKLALMLRDDEELSDLVETLCETFFTAGYVYCLTNGKKR